MNELILLGVAFFIFCFGSLILNEIFRFGFAVADKLLENSGRIIKAPFKVAFKLISLGIRFLLKKFGKADYYTVRPIYDNQNITPLELQRMRNHNHQTLKNIGNASVEIEYTQPNRLTK
jgi:hypothetical protein